MQSLLTSKDAKEKRGKDLRHNAEASRKIEALEKLADIVATVERILLSQITLPY